LRERNGERPATDDAVNGAWKFSGIRNARISKPSFKKSLAQVVLAELSGSDTCLAAGLVVRGHAPVLVLCRELIAAGLDPDRAMEVFRGATLALHIRTIGQAAGLELNSHGTAFVTLRARRAASPVRKSLSGLYRLAPQLEKRGGG
jgi:hypothetical protein